jgi:cell division protein FtsB
MIEKIWTGNSSEDVKTLKPFYQTLSYQYYKLYTAIMKNFILILFVLLAIPAFSQKKKQIEAKDAQIDTLTKANAALLAEVDSISAEHKVYYGLYTTIKEKVLMEDFDPARFPEIVDSIRSHRDSTVSVLSTSYKDSLAMLSKENQMLKTKIDTMTVALNAVNANNSDKTKLVAELKDLKALLDAKAITQAEYDEKKKLVMDKWQ